MTFDPKSRIPDDGTITTAKLGGDVTTLAKDLLTQSTTTDAKATLEVSAGGGAGVVPPITL